jgi:hypothetical protein
MVKLYKNEEVIGDVDANTKLDYWDGRNYSNGGTGRHLGFGQTKNGEFYLIHKTQWQGEQNYAEIVSPDRIVKEAIKSNNINELEEYPELLSLYEEKYNEKNIEKRSKTFSIRININDSEETINKKIEGMKNKIREFQEI